MVSLQEVLLNVEYRFLGEIEIDNCTVLNSDIITLDFTVSKKKGFYEIVYD